MTTKKTSKPATVKPVNATAIGKHIGEQLGELQAGYDKAQSATAAINADIKTLRDAKIKIGASRKTCAVASAIYDAMPERLAAGTRANMLSTIRKAVNEGGKLKWFSHNPNRDNKAKKTKGAKTSGGTIMIAIPSGAKASDAAAKLRAGFEKLRVSSDDLAALAAFLVDALDDAGFPESDE
jgi:hypothetical protein